MDEFESIEYQDQDNRRLGGEHHKKFSSNYCNFSDQIGKQIKARIIPNSSYSNQG